MGRGNRGVERGYKHKHTHTQGTRHTTLESFVVDLLFSNLKLGRKATIFRTFEIEIK